MTVLTPDFSKGAYANLYNCRQFYLISPSRRFSTQRVEILAGGFCV
jgi:hypothetical protein